MQVCVRDLDARLQNRRHRPNQRNDLQVPENLRLKVDIRHPAVEQWRVRRDELGGYLGARPEQEWVGIVPAVDLYGEIEPLPGHRGEEGIEFRRAVRDIVIVVVDSSIVWDNDDPVDRSGPAG